MSPESSDRTTTRLKIITRYSSVEEFVRGFCHAVDEGHVLVGFQSTHPIDSLWRFNVCLASGESVFRGVGRLDEILPRPDENGRVGARLALLWLDQESALMHDTLQRARGQRARRRASGLAAGPSFARGTIPPFVEPRLPLPPPELEPGAVALPRLAGFDEQEEEDATRLFGQDDAPGPAAALVGRPDAALAGGPEDAYDAASILPVRSSLRWVLSGAALLAAAALLAFMVAAGWR